MADEKRIEIRDKIPCDTISSAQPAGRSSATARPSHLLSLLEAGQEKMKGKCLA
jgi:hypothetical protein